MDKNRLAEVMRFGVVGVVATLIHYAIYYLLLSWCSPSLSFTVGYAVSFICNYILSSRYTFRVSMSLKRLLSFGLSHLTNYVIGLLLLNLFLFLGVSPVLAPLPVFVIAVPINYLLVRFALTRRDSANDGYFIFLIFVGLAMLWLNLLDAPTLSDDMIYRFQWNVNEADPVRTIDGIGDLLRSQLNHYMTTNGRLPVHLLAQAFFVFVPRMVLQVLNTLLFVLMVHLFVRWTSVGKKHQLLAAVVVCFLLFVVFQGFRTTMVWALGAFNYLWVVGVYASAKVLIFQQITT